MDDPANSTESVLRATELLLHGDASLLLSELNPPAAWLPALRQQRVFDSGFTSPGPWIAARLNDPDMIRAAAAHPEFDDQTVRYVERGLDQKRDELGPVRTRCWEILLSAKKPVAGYDHDLKWYRQAPRIRAGEVGYEARQIVAELLRPRIRIGRHLQLFEEQVDSRAANPEETLHSFMRLDFQPRERVGTDDILEAWPNVEFSLVRLLHKLERLLLDTLEHAEDVGFTIGYDRSDSDVPSIAPHPQNQYRSGFYPIVRVMADLWERLALVAPERAVALSRPWIKTHFLLFKRLAVFSATNTVHPVCNLVDAVMSLDDHEFWVSGAQVEIMRGLVERWDEFMPEARDQLEERINADIPRELFEDDAFDEAHWQSVRDNATYRRLSRLEAADKPISEASVNLLKEIAERHPEWRPSPGDRDDFHSWSETRTGPDGDVELLKDVPEEGLLGEALRIEQERQFDQSDLWRQFCSSDPSRAFRGLVAEAGGETGTYTLGVPCCGLLAGRSTMT
ncbi:hypothetical protein [Cribrihabitans neustonicus]|uniref:hypothetical protein n=1 Tax=Cribrihabitans neustonicus TaxID=1429085 RepID=UPI003B5B11D9